MPIHPLGPNAAAVEAFLRSLSSIPWFTAVGAPPTVADAELIDFHFLAAHHEDPWALWGAALANAEAAIEHLEFAHHRIAYHDAVQQAYAVAQFLPAPSVDALYQRVTEEYADPKTGYYRETLLAPYELIDFPHRLIRGAALELMVADLEPTLSFFQDQMPWFRAGRWPVGWRGAWPEGRVLLW